MYNVFVGTTSVPFVGVTLNVKPLHIVLVTFAITGVGFTETVMVNDAPAQLPAAPLTGVTVYTKVCTIFVTLVSV